MEAESQEEFDVLASEYGAGKVVGIHSWLDHDDEEITSGTCMGIVPFLMIISTIIQ